jgi:predicted AAA+ superfamily ATPase
MNRIQKQLILRDLKKKMVFLVGPRQVGKTWLAKDIATGYRNPLYLNYDHPEDRDLIHHRAWLNDVDLLVFDELHKMTDWKNYLKGVFDTRAQQHILVTGSARLQTFRQAGDSLAGRYFAHRLLPFTPAELHQTDQPVNLDLLLKRGGFPEPLNAETDVDADRWRKQYADSLIRTDILDFERVHDLRAIQLLLEMLRRRVGSPLSFKSLAEDLQIAPNTVKKYIQIFEALFIVFRVTPFSRNIARSLVKEPKLYFYDQGMVLGDAGAALENLLAISLYKHILGREDTTGKNLSLNYLRTKEGREVEFCIVEEDAVEKMIEVKASDSNLDKNLRYFSERYPFPAVQVVGRLNREYRVGNIEIRKADKFLRQL